MSATEKFIAIMDFITLLGLILTAIGFFPIVPMFGLAIYLVIKTLLFKKMLEYYKSASVVMDIFIAFVLILSYFVNSGFVNILSFFAILYMVFKVIFGFTTMR